MISPAALCTSVLFLWNAVGTPVAPDAQPAELHLLLPCSTPPMPQGRPKGPEKKSSLEPVAKRMSGG